MKIRNILLVATFVAPAAAQAAGIGAGAPPSSAQLVCDLAGTCDDTAEAPTQDKPDTRGFSVVRTGAATTPAKPQLAAQARPERRPATQMVAARPAASAMEPGRHPRGAVGHANLEITFLSGSSALTDSGKASADQFAKALQAPQLASKRFLIGGHTSAVGARPYNIDLSERRAQAVVDYLVAQGANRSQFDVKGFGFDEPVAGTAPSAPGNRRVEVVVLP
jgi:outer membrane protein OmpA-like peptidoglycan-associated protein